MSVTKSLQQNGVSSLTRSLILSVGFDILGIIYYFNLYTINVWFKQLFKKVELSCDKHQNPFSRIHLVHFKFNRWAYY